MPRSRIAPREWYVGEARDEGGVLAAVLLRHGHDQLLADVAREVEVDVGNGLELAVQEPPERELGLDRVDMREPGQIADDRADRASASTPRRKDVPGDGSASDLECHLARQLEHFPVQQEESGQAELADQRELFVQPCPRALLVSIRAAVPLVEGAVADSGELRDRRLVPVREIRIAVAELLGQVELETRGQLPGARDGSRIVREALRHRGRREEDTLVVAAPLTLAAVQRRPVLDSDERVLERRTPYVVRVRVTGRDRPHAQRLGELAKDAFRRASPRSYGRWSSTKNRSRPKRAPARPPLFGWRTARPRRAQPDRHTSPSFSSSSRL